MQWFNPLPPAEMLREILDYCPLTGDFRWKISRGGVRVGSIAGCQTPRGYRQIGISGAYHLSHRLAWKIMTGSDPVEQIDHINNDRADNRFANLRAATASQQRMNQTGFGSSKFLGVNWHRAAQKWQASIKVDSKARHLGYFVCELEAARAYDAAAEKHHGEFANLNSRTPAQ
mgnify:CR=1 FL=1